jgi:hypothetical protein
LKEIGGHFLRGVTGGHPSTSCTIPIFSARCCKSQPPMFWAHCAGLRIPWRVQKSYGVTSTLPRIECTSQQHRVTIHHFLSRSWLPPNLSHAKFSLYPTKHIQKYTIVGTFQPASPVFYITLHPHRWDVPSRIWGLFFLRLQSAPSA